MLKKNKKKVNLCGNIGRPILDQKIYINSNVIIELSSFQLFYSKFLKLDISMILNLKKDHIDWHSSFKKYKEAKFRIFRNQKKSSHALLNEKGLIKYYNKNKFIPKLKKTLFSNIKNLRFESQHLNSKVNKENLSFVFDTIKLLGINKKNFITSLKNYKGLEHRQEYFHKIGKTKFINDSKATNFESAKNAISNYKNIYWIVGGQPKINEIFSLKRLKKNILKAYIIGNHQSFFKQKLHNQIDIIISKNLKKALKDISYDIRINNKVEDKTVLLSPASASFDQFRNFEDRGNIFKKIVRSYGKKSF